VLCRISNVSDPLLFIDKNLVTANFSLCLSATLQHQGSSELNQSNWRKTGFCRILEIQTARLLQILTVRGTSQYSLICQTQDIWQTHIRQQNKWVHWERDILWTKSTCAHAAVVYYLLDDWFMITSWADTARKCGARGGFSYICIYTLLSSAKSKQTTVADNNPGNPYIQIMQHPKTKTTIASSCSMLQWLMTISPCSKLRRWRW